MALYVITQLDSTVFLPHTFDDTSFSSVSCAHILATTLDNTTMIQTITGLDAATDYSCCVEAQYTDSSENSRACADGTTLDGSKNLFYADLQAQYYVFCTYIVYISIHCHKCAIIPAIIIMTGL